MKKIILTTLLAAVSIAAFCQDEEKVEKEKVAINFTHELGIETNNLVSRLISDENNQELPDNPYLLTYKIVAGNWALRTGLGGDRSKSVEREDGFADSHTEEFGRLDVRFGLERRFVLGKKWMGNVSLDGIGFFSKDKIIDDSGFDVITNSNTVNGWGFGPSFGIQFNVTEKFSIYTEGFFYYTNGERQSGRTFQNFPEFDDELRTIEEEDMKISLPSVLYLVFRF